MIWHMVGFPHGLCHCPWSRVRQGHVRPPGHAHDNNNHSFTRPTKPKPPPKSPFKYSERIVTSWWRKRIFCNTQCTWGVISTPSCASLLAPINPSMKNINAYASNSNLIGTVHGEFTLCTVSLIDCGASMVVIVNDAELRQQMTSHVTTSITIICWAS